MQEKNEVGGGPQAPPDAERPSPDESGRTTVVIEGEPGQPLNQAELARIASLAQEGGVVEAEIHGQRLLIVADMHLPVGRHMALEVLTRLAAAGEVLALHPGEPLLERRLDAPDVHIKMVEAAIECDFDERRGKGKRRRPWESPYGNSKHQKRQQSHNIKQMLRRSGPR